MLISLKISPLMSVLVVYVGRIFASKYFLQWNHICILTVNLLIYRSEKVVFSKLNQFDGARCFINYHQVVVKQAGELSTIDKELTV